MTVLKKEANSGSQKLPELALGLRKPAERADARGFEFLRVWKQLVQILSGRVAVAFVAVALALKRAHTDQFDDFHSLLLWLFPATAGL